MTEPRYGVAVATAYMFREKYDPGWRYALFDPFLPISTNPSLLCAKFSTLAARNGQDIQTFLQTAPSSDGFTLRRGTKYIIVYNDSVFLPESRVRFTLAHELGHVVLQHKMEGDEVEEQEANTFARNLLAPRRLALKYGISFGDYPKVFGVSAAAARMCERFREIDERYIK